MIDNLLLKKIHNKEVEEIKAEHGISNVSLEKDDQEQQ